MSRVLILGAGVSGHTAAAFARKWLSKQHDVAVISPNAEYNWIPSNVWVGVGLLPKRKVVFPLEPVYRRAGVEFHHGAAVAIYPEGDGTGPEPFVEYIPSGGGERRRVTYDFLINATGPTLDFEATPGLGPEGHTFSVCTADHAEETAKAFQGKVERMRRGERQRFLVGVGHGSATCQGAAFEYIVNLEFELRAKKVRDRADILWITNEYDLGDFGLGGLHIRHGGYVTPSRIFTESLFAERGIAWITRAAVRQVEPGRLTYETLDGETREAEFDFAMLLPPFSGVGLRAYARDGRDITEALFAPNGFMKVDAEYSAKPYEEWRAADWPSRYRSPEYPNIFAVGIAFAPPHAISKPRKTPDGKPIFPAPPRTGMPSAMIGKAVARSVADLVQGKDRPLHRASMAEMGAACVASAGANPFTGTAASITVFPIVPDFERYPVYGRDMDRTFGEIGLAGHWIKIILHHMFLHKARLRPGWSLIPE